ncbi:MAG TPA: UDP-galactopyranose mutase [Spirochaetia bacterium]
MDFDYVIVGAGFAGAVCAERLANAYGKKVLVVERRRHVGGNAFDELDGNGILIHRYGPHIFHTKVPEVWAYLSRFTEWRAYHHRVLGVVDGALVPVPFNLTSLHTLFPGSLADRLEQTLVEKYGFGARVPILEMKKESDKDLRLLADFVYQKLFLIYTTKQWGLPPEKLAASVTARIPVVVSRDDRYFNDQWQGLPLHGYTRLFERLLDSPRIKLLLNTDYREVAADLKPRKLIYSGMVDALFDYKFGKLTYRSLEFRWKNVARDSFQPAATVNYPMDYDYTRITEFRKLTGQEAPSTTVAYEYPRPYETEADEAYYPIPLDSNVALHERYKEEAARLTNVHFVGRLAQYTYLNMDQVVAAALKSVVELEGPAS